ncbi:MAG TPA: DUF721 domain-containing protein [Armatimonadota bacterium]|jgi:hypothetical protein
MMKRDNYATSLNDVLGHYLQDRGFTQHSAEVLAAVLWAEAVGPWYARHTEVVRAEGGVLTVHCDSAPLAQQLTADSDRILGRLNARVATQLASMGEATAPEGEVQVITEIRPTSAYQGRSQPRAVGATAEGEQPQPTPDQLDAYPLTAEEEQHVQELATGIVEDGVRRRFAATMRSSLRLKRWRRQHGYQACPTCDHLLPPGEERCPFCQPPPAPPQVRF